MSNEKISFMNEVSINETSFINDELSISKLSLNDIIKTIDLNKEKICKYIICRDAYYSASTGEVLQDYANNEKPRKEELDVILEIREAYPISSIISFIIEYIYLSQGNMEGLKMRIKSLKIPKPNRFWKDLISIYKLSKTVLP